MPNMSDNLNLPEASVDSILKSTPKAARFFLNWQTTCVGCCFARFCTLQDVINSYQFNEQEFLEGVQQLVAQNLQTGASK